MATLYRLLIGLWVTAAVYSSLAQPVLNLTSTGNQSRIFWPNAPANFVLQSSPDLRLTNWNWARDTVPATDNSQTSVTVTNDPKTRFFRLIAIPTNTADAMALIPAGPFTMGDSLDGESDAMPTVTANLSPFYMDTNVVSYTQWLAVFGYAANHGYGFDNPGAGQATNQPVQTINWWDVVKWCNARSQMAGLTPVYYTDASLTRLFTNGQASPFVNWMADGYRLPTEAEWEKAARGGLIGQRFPWGATISWSQANYLGDPGAQGGYSYDLATAIGIDPAFSGGFLGKTNTSPVGSFAPNGYGLYDMAGNVLEWCWDWYGTPYAGGSDPSGPASSRYGWRVLRGGSWGNDASQARCAYRYNATIGPADASIRIGFRCVRGI